MQIKVKIKTQKTPKIIKHKDFYEIHLKSKPIENQANKELLKLLKTKFKNPRIIKGLKSKEKIISIQN